jgi:catechol 2,3-dioxygenase-like lactoylglutathione lyase family enzyme
MAMRLGNIVFDSADPQAAATFYTELTGWPIVRTDGDWIDLQTDTGAAFSLQLAPDHIKPNWPDASRPQQAHVDFIVDDMDAEHARALALGATLLDDSAEHPTFRVFADLDGHPFCLCRS